MDQDQNKTKQIVVLWTLPKEKIKHVNFLMGFLHSNHLSICNVRRSDKDLQLSLDIKIIVLFWHLG